ncbi:Dehydrin DHN3 [Triticum urartu]|uniref:Dehydrin n=2 Tax=Triticum TaxID=4564 RepID=A0A9R0Y7Y8_TRITD|nr:Dehydrin DHN3 [Triticum urartu]VAI50506.1 unnamed protein product [Triticum turgidum subsp. durum]
MEHQGHGTGEKKGIMENIKEKLPGGQGDHQQTAGTHGQHGHTGMTGTEMHDTTATGGTHGQQGLTGTTGTGTHGTGEKKSLMDKDFPSGITDFELFFRITPSPFLETSL